MLSYGRIDTDRELRYTMLRQTNPVEVQELVGKAQDGVDHRWRVYEEMATWGVR